MNHIKLTKDKLSVEEIFDLVRSNSCGAVYMFLALGSKDIFERYDQVNSECEAFTVLDLNSLKNVCDKVRNYWPNIENIVIKTRIGPLSNAETRVVVAVSSKQAVESIKATEWIIDNLKKVCSTRTKETSMETNPNSSSPIFKKREITQIVEAPYVPPYLIQLKATKDEIEERITKFMQRKRSEVDVHNIREFCGGDRNSESTCARVDAVLQKKKGSKSHLQVHRVLNSYQHRDQKNSNYLTQFIPSNGVEERLTNVENQLSLTKPVPKNIYQRLKVIEDRVLQLESISPEYIQFWDKVSLPTSNKSLKKRTYFIDEMDDLIAELEMKSN